MAWGSVRGHIALTLRLRKYKLQALGVKKTAGRKTVTQAGSGATLSAETGTRPLRGLKTAEHRMKARQGHWSQGGVRLLLRNPHVKNS